MSSNSGAAQALASRTGVPCHQNQSEGDPWQERFTGKGDGACWCQERDQPKDSVDTSDRDGVQNVQRATAIDIYAMGTCVLQQLYNDPLRSSYWDVVRIEFMFSTFKIYGFQISCYRSGGRDLKSSGAYPMPYGAKIATLHKEWMDWPWEISCVFDMYKYKYHVHGQHASSGHVSKDKCYDQPAEKSKIADPDHLLTLGFQELGCLWADVSPSV